MTYPPAEFHRQLSDRLIPQARLFDEPVSLVLFDLDRLGEVNREYGRRLADEVIETVAQVLEEVVPPQAVLASHEGDQYRLALPGFSLSQALVLVEEFRRRVADQHWPGYAGLRVTCSAGLAAYPAHASSGVHLLKQAERALVIAKHTGRNKSATPLPTIIKPEV